MADLDELFVHELYTPQAGRLKEFDLRLDEQIKCDLGHEQAGARAGGIPYCGADVLGLKRLRGVDARECVAKDVIENVVDPCTAGEFFCGDVNVRTFDGRDKVAGELGHEPEDECALLCDATARLERTRDEGWVEKTSLVGVTVNGLITKRVELMLCLTHKRVKARFHIRQLVANMVQKHLKKVACSLTPAHLSIKKKTQKGRARTWLRVLARYFVPFLIAMFRYCGWLLKNSVSLSSASDMHLSASMSRCERFTTPMKPNLSGYTRPVSTSCACVPASIKSSLVRMPIVRRPWGSTDRASLSESELARSTFAAETARMTLMCGCGCECVCVRVCVRVCACGR